ncbi:ribonuclease P, Rpp29 [Candidatus Micrarchaeota archaeon CG10_big_fil_rev_8_21_14_0_10_45_29]|nr:MAG: ribonuclease P, Rpp29 [Candidatus Micrarchaeota archaeon CG10_big_fil_rev_8_21_14_0_10_45_29]
MALDEEWIGKRAKITASQNPNNIGICGEIVDETLNTITFLTKENERKIVPKKGARMQMEGSKEILELSNTLARPHERSKKCSQG